MTQAVVRLGTAAEFVGLRAKLKICLALYVVLAQVGSVYRVRYPPSYQSVSSFLLAPLRQDLLAWIPGLHLGCLGVKGIAASLAVYISFPLLVVLLALGVSYAVWRSVLRALPFILFWLSIAFPAVSSHGFQAVARCDCFEEVTDDLSGTTAERCYLPARPTTLAPISSRSGWWPSSSTASACPRCTRGCST